MLGFPRPLVSAHWSSPTSILDACCLPDSTSIPFVPSSRCGPPTSVGHYFCLPLSSVPHSTDSPRHEDQDKRCSGSRCGDAPRDCTRHLSQVRCCLFSSLLCRVPFSGRTLLATPKHGYAASLRPSNCLSTSHGATPTTQHLPTCSAMAAIKEQLPFKQRLDTNHNGQSTLPLGTKRRHNAPGRSTGSTSEPGRILTKAERQTRKDSAITSLDGSLEQQQDAEEKGHTFAALGRKL
jgi:hypothetical protein